MKYGKIPGVDKPVSRIFLGTCTKRFMGGGDCSDLLNAALSLGINAIDTARVYRGAERSIGRWLRSSDAREKVVILSKCAHPDLFGRKRVNERAIRADLKKSLSLLGTQYIDIYIAHRDDTSVPVGQIVEIFNAILSEGKIRAFGGSNWSHERIEQANEYAYSHNLVPFAVSSPYYSLAEQYGDPWGKNGLGITGSQNASARAWYAESGLPVVAYSSLARGVLSGRIKSSDYSSAGKIFDRVTMRGYVSKENFERLRRCEELAKAKGVSVAQTALAYVLCSGMNTFAAVSGSGAGRLKENALAADLTLTAAECSWLESGDR